MSYAHRIIRFLVREKIGKNEDTFLKSENEIDE